MIRSAGGVLLLAVAAHPAFGQQRSFDVQASLDCFEKRTLAHARSCPEGVISVQVILEELDAYTERDARALLKGLADFAIHHDSSIVSTMAATYLMAPGEAGRNSRLPPHQLVQQVVRSGRSGALFAIARSAPLQRDQPWALDVLSEIAGRDDSGAHHPPISLTAVMAMRSMGSAGRQRLADLIAAGAIRNPRARGAAVK